MRVFYPLHYFPFLHNVNLFQYLTVRNSLNLNISDKTHHLDFYWLTTHTFSVHYKYLQLAQLFYYLKLLEAKML